MAGTKVTKGGKAIKVTSLNWKKLAVAGAHPAGIGLVLRIRGNSRTWTLRYMIAGKAHWMALGSPDDVPTVTLANAIELAETNRMLARAGQDPLETRRTAGGSKGEAKERTFRQIASLYIGRYEGGWKNAKHRQQWTNTLTTYAFPVIGDTLVEDIDTAAVRRVLTPIWTAKPETASRLRGRIEAVLTYAQAAGWRTGDNPARLDGPLGILLGPHGDKAKVVHHSALPWKEITGFMTALDGRDAVASRALKLLILTATRTSETLNATWAEIDMAAKVWTIPASRMKGGQEHQVPLSDVAVAVLRQVEELRASSDPGEPVFPGQKPGKPLSNMALLMLLRRMEHDDLTAHGFRSTFRDWAGDCTSHPREVAEAALAHTIGNKAENAYARSTLLEKRRALMNEWGRFCTAPTATKGDNVVEMRQAAG